VGTHDKKAKNMQNWRKNLLEHHLGATLIAFELVLSAIFFVVSYLTGNIYFKGVAVGLVIAWVTGAIAYYIKKTLKL